MKIRLCVLFYKQNIFYVNKMVLQKFQKLLPVTVLNRMWSRSLSKYCSTKSLNVSRSEFRAIHQMLLRSGINSHQKLQNLILPSSSLLHHTRQFSSTPYLKNQDGKNDKDKDGM